VLGYNCRRFAAIFCFGSARIHDAISLSRLGGVIAAGVFAGFIAGCSGELPQGRELIATLESNLPVALPKAASVATAAVQAVAAQPVKAFQAEPAPATLEVPEAEQ